MNENYIQAVTNGLLALGFIGLVVMNSLLFRILWRRDHPTKLGKAMMYKYLAWIPTGLLLAALQIYSTYFNLTKSTGIFTFPVRTIIRVGASGFLLLALICMAFMIWELARAERELLPPMVLQLEEGSHDGD